MILDKFGQNIAIYGLGLSGKACIDFLANHDIKPVIIDDATEESLAPILNEFQGKFSDAFLADQNRNWESILDKLDTIVISPGIKLNEYVDNLAQMKQVIIVSEIEFAFQLCPGKIICVSGSNGKSTTVTLIHKMLENGGFSSHLAGNIGIPFVSTIDKVEPNDYIALEVSSYQLERIINFKPHIAILTNITEDHLERHGSMTGYVRTKGRMFENQDFNDYAVLNHNDMLTWKAFNGAISSLNVFSTDDLETSAERELINSKEVISRAAMNDMVLAIKTDDEIVNILHSTELRIPGNHNIENALAASLAAYLAGVPINSIRDTLREFQGIEHRIEFICEYNGVRFYNDSKATNVESTITALKTFPEESINLILGGSEKGSDFEPLWLFFRDRESPFKLFLTGPSGIRMAKSLSGLKWNFNFELSNSFDDCANAAIRNTNHLQVVLLSPACASFDEFKNFEHRGTHFKSILAKYLEELSHEV